MFIDSLKSFADEWFLAKVKLGGHRSEDAERWFVKGWVEHEFGTREINKDYLAGRDARRKYEGQLSDEL